MEQEGKVQPETGSAAPNQEPMAGEGFSGNAEAGQTGGLESGTESCSCEHETETAPVEGQSRMDGGPAEIPGATVGQMEAQVHPQQIHPQEPQNQQPAQVQAQPQYQPQQAPQHQAQPPQYQPQQAPQVHFAPQFPPQQMQPGQYPSQYPPAGHPGMTPSQGYNMSPDMSSHMSPQMNPAASGQGCGHMGADAKHVEHDENRFGQMADMVGRFIEGEAGAADMVKGLFSLNFRDDQFWKGALAGAVASLVFNSDMVKQGVGKVFGGGSSKAVQSSETPKEAVEKAETAAKTKKSQ